MNEQQNNSLSSKATHINPKFKNAHINPNFLTKKPLQTSPSNIHINPKFLNNSTSQIPIAPAAPIQAATTLAAPYSTNYVYQKPKKPEHEKAKIITLSKRKLVRQPFPCTSTSSVPFQSTTKTVVPGIQKMIKIGERKLINPNVTVATSKLRQITAPVQSIFKIRSPGKVFHKVSPLKVDRINRMGTNSLYKIDRRQTRKSLLHLDRSFLKTSIQNRSHCILYGNLLTTRVKISDYKLLRMLVFNFLNIVSYW